MLIKSSGVSSSSSSDLDSDNSKEAVIDQIESVLHYE